MTSAVARTKWLHFVLTWRRALNFPILMGGNKFHLKSIPNSCRPELRPIVLFFRPEYGSNLIHFGATHTHIAYIRKYLRLYCGSVRSWRVRDLEWKMLRNVSLGIIAWQICITYPSEEFRWNGTLKGTKKFFLNMVKKDQLRAIALIKKVLLKMVAMATDHTLLKYHFIALTSPPPVV